MGTWKKRVAAVVMAAGIVGAMAPAASAQTVTAVPCEAIFGEALCAQIRATGAFVNQTVANTVAAVDEWRKRIAAEGEEAADYVFCVLSGECPILYIEP